jgi:hypothetical protein
MTGTTPPPDKLNTIDVLVQEICGQHQPLETLVQRFR